MTSITLFYALITGLIVLSGIVTLAASWADLQHTAQRHSLRKRVRQLTRVSQPSITIIIFCDHDEMTIIDTLRSILRAHYVAYRVVIIDNASHDNTSRVVRTWLKRHEDPRFGYIKKRQPTTWLTAAQSAYKKIPNTPYILTLRAGDQFTPSLLKTTVAQLQISPAVRVLHLRQLVSNWQQIDRIVPQLIDGAQSIAYRAFAAIAQLHHIHTDTATLYYHEAFVSPHPGQWSADYFTASPLVHNTPRTEYQRVTSKILEALAMAGLSIPLILAATLQTSVPLIVMWLAITCWMLMIALVDSTLPRGNRPLLIAVAPIGYVLFYAWLLVTTAAHLLRALAVLLERYRIGSQADRGSHQHNVLNNILTFKIWHPRLLPSILRHDNKGRTNNRQMHKK